MSGIFVVIPSKKGNREQGEKCANLVRVRAGVPVNTITIEDTEGVGFFSLINREQQRLGTMCEWLVYCPDDYYPGKDFIKIALEKSNGKKLICFNDGKWHGSNATAGMIHTSLIPRLYSSGTVFHPGYKWHGADPDLTERAKILGEYIYVPDAVLMEIDYKKHIEGNQTNQSDMEYYMKRRRRGFTWEI